MVFHIGNIRACHVFQGGIGSEQRGSHQIDPGIGALGGQPHGDHQLVILLIVQGAYGLRVSRFQYLND